MCNNCGCISVARSRVYQFLAAAFSYPDSALVHPLQVRLPDAESSLAFLGDKLSLRSLRTLVPALLACSPGDLESQYTATFGHTISTECPPYEAEYGQSHIFQKSQTLADIAGFYKAFGLELAPNLHDRLDHLSVELEFMHFLCLKEAYALTKRHSQDQLELCREAQTKFLGEHLGQWVPGFGESLSRVAAGTVYALAGRLLRRFLMWDARTLGVPLATQATLIPVQPLEEEVGACEVNPDEVPV